ncbi:MAG: hypothetical protein COA79_25600 [Planctomycetota bacterium]|nr:MAG: hypothetical protein COA79_25600 [Planctomycetota bacterium]
MIDDLKIIFLRNYDMNISKRILVVEDDYDLRCLITDLLLSADYLVDSVNSGHLGFEKASKENFDLILMDIRMPGWDGIETIAGLNMVNSALKFLIISGHISESNLSRLEKAQNVIDIIRKPFDNNHLLRVIQNCFDECE